MSARVEWADAGYALRFLYIADPGEIDSDGSVNEKPALIIDEGGDFMVLEGTKEELLAFGAKVSYLASRMEEGK